MKKVILGLLSLVCYNGWGQSPISVFDCNTYSKTLDQATIDANSSFFGTCFEMGINSAVSVQGNAHKTIQASKQIHLKNDVHLGTFSNEGQTHLLISDSSQIDVAVMNYENLNSVLRYKKLEFGIPLPADIRTRVSDFINKTGAENMRLNPFVEWDIDVEAIFQQPGWYETINGFYTREYQQNSQTNDWDDVGTDYPFRIRYAPPRNGEWKAYIIIKVNGQQVYTSNEFFFNVVESGDPGYVHVHENNRNLKRGDRMIFPVGQNFPSPGGPGGQGCRGTHSSIVPNTERCTDLDTWNNYLDEVETYLSLGNQYGDPNKPKYIRFMSMPWASSLEFEEKGNYYKRLHYASEIDKLINLCEEYDGLMIYNLMMQSQFMYRNYYWEWSWEHLDTNGLHLVDKGPNSDFPYYCYNDDPGPGGKKPHEMFTNEVDLNYHKQRTRYIVARYGYSTQIYEWELLSEPWHLNENLYGEESPFQNSNHPDHNAVKDAVYNYHKVMSDYIKDTLDWNRQLVGIDMGYGEGTFDEQSIGLKNIDIVGFNPYYTSPNALISSSNNSMNGYVNSINQIRAALNLYPVPVIIPEGGIDNNYSDCSNFDLRAVDEMTLGFTGVAGFHFWDGRDPKEDGSYHTELWKNTFRAQNHMNGDDVINTLSDGGGYWSYGMGKAEYNENLREKYSVEHQYYTSSNKKKAVGYVRNRSFNVKTRSTNGSLCYNEDFKDVNNSPRNTEWNDVYLFKRLRINNLKTHTEYRIDWYSNNQYIKTDCIETNKKNGNWGITLEYPELTVSHSGNNDLPVVWYVIYQQPCSSGMAQQDDIEEVEEGMNRKQLLDTQEAYETILNVHPNPFQNHISIRSPQKDQMVLKSAEGKVIGNYEIEEGQSKVNTANLSSGMYILTFINQNKSFKLIKL